MTTTARPALGTSEALAYTAGALVFTIVAILNCGGYRYGIGDQAFYVPAVVQHLDPALFPRDRSLLSAQDRFMLYDEAIAAIAKISGASVPALFFAAYLLGTALLFGAIASIGRVLYASTGAIVVLAALLTLRHRITQTGANSLESYFQPRMLAFAIGAWAITMYLRGRGTLALLLVAGAFAVHPTTALWFGIWVIAALAVSERRWRVPVAALIAVAGLGVAWAVTLGPLRGRLARMDPMWASAMAGKDYIFPSDWNASFWLVNMAYPVVAGALFLARRRRGLTTDREAGMVAGALVLVIVFLTSWPLMAARIALAVQLQTSRVFWMLDFLTAIYIAWALAELPSRQVVRRAVAAMVVAIAVARGVFVWSVEHAGSPIVRVGLPRDNWTDAMEWIAQSPTDTHVLADPGHAWKYGTSVRVSAQRDVYLEEVKDLALALYSRDVAMNALQRIDAASNLETMSADQLRGLAARYDLDYLVADRDVDLPLAYRNAQFRIYSLR